MNIFGGIMKCDVIASGIVNAAKQVGIQVPLIVRLEGTNVEAGKEILSASGMDIIAADDLDDAAKKPSPRWRDAETRGEARGLFLTSRPRETTRRPSPRPAPRPRSAREHETRARRKKRAHNVSKQHSTQSSSPRRARSLAEHFVNALFAHYPDADELDGELEHGIRRDAALARGPRAPRPIGAVPQRGGDEHPARPADLHGRHGAPDPMTAMSQPLMTPAPPEKTKNLAKSTFFPSTSSW